MKSISKPSYTLAIPYKERPMNSGQTVFSQIMKFLPLNEFRKCVERYQGDYKVQDFSCLDQFLCLAFAQLTFRESLRDIEACLRSMKPKLYHMGFRSIVSRNTLANANEKRDWRIYADFAQILMRTAHTLYHNDPFGLELQEAVYAMDATRIDLCLSIFPWARFGKDTAAIKIHTLLNLRGAIPAFIHVTKANVCDHDLLDDLALETAAFYLLDRGYIDLDRLYKIHQALAFFIIRQRAMLNLNRVYSHPVDKATGIYCDQTIRFTGRYSAVDYPEKLRRIRYFDFQSNRRWAFLTNNFHLPALTIAQLYKYRWQVELFFRWIKQHLRIKAFFGTSFNAVKTQIWVALAVYLLIAIIKKRLNSSLNLYTILQILSISIFEKTSISQLITQVDCKDQNNQITNQLLLFNL